MDKIRVLVVDDSALMRKFITEMLSSSPRIEVVGKARDGAEAIQMSRELKPDLMTLDVEMPVLDGLGTLKALLPSQKPKVIMCSSLTQQGAEITMQCLALGAFDFVAKPSGSISLNIETVKDDLLSKVFMAVASPGLQPSVGSPVSRIPIIPTDLGKESKAIVLIGCSTGGPRALLTVIPALPANLGVPVVVVQHMPENFTRSLADRLNSASPLSVKEAEEGNRLKAGEVIVAKGGFHLEFDSHGFVRLTKSNPVHAVRPSIDVTIASMSSFYKDMIGVILTGMGKDGAQGLKAILKSGGHTIAEHESTCAVYGMPRAAVEIDAIKEISPLPGIPAAIVAAVCARHGLDRAQKAS